MKQVSADELIIKNQGGWDNTIRFMDVKNDEIAILDKDGLRFFPRNNETKQEMAEKFITCLKVVADPLFTATWNPEQKVELSIEGVVKMWFKYGEIFLVDEPQKPQDYWIFECVKKSWKALYK
jgi:hypothetical protein